MKEQKYICPKHKTCKDRKDCLEAEKPHVFNKETCLADGTCPECVLVETIER